MHIPVDTTALPLSLDSISTGALAAGPDLLSLGLPVPCKCGQKRSQSSKAGDSPCGCGTRERQFHEHQGCHTTKGKCGSSTIIPDLQWMMKNVVGSRHVHYPERVMESTHACQLQDSEKPMEMDSLENDMGPRLVCYEVYVVPGRAQCPETDMAQKLAHHQGNGIGPNHSWPLVNDREEPTDVSFPSNAKRLRHAKYLENGVDTRHANWSQNDEKHRHGYHSGNDKKDRHGYHSLPSDPDAQVLATTQRNSWNICIFIVETSIQWVAGNQAISIFLRAARGQVVLAIKITKFFKKIAVFLCTLAS